jgi:hypothetical protein
MPVAPELLDQLDAYAAQNAERAQVEEAVKAALRTEIDEFRASLELLSRPIPPGHPIRAAIDPIISSLNLGTMMLTPPPIPPLMSPAPPPGAGATIQSPT